MLRLIAIACLLLGVPCALAVDLRAHCGFRPLAIGVAAPNAARVAALEAKFADVVAQNRLDRNLHGISWNGTLKRAGRQYDFEPDGRVFGLPYEANGKTFIDFRSAGDVSPVLRPLPFEDFVKRAMPEFLRDVKVGLPLLVPLKRKGLRGRNAFQPAKVERVLKRKVELRTANGELVRYTPEELLLQNGLYPIEEVGGVHAFFEEGGTGDVLLDRRGGMVGTLGESMIEDGFYVAVKRLPHDGNYRPIWNDLTLSEMRQARADGIQILFYPALDASVATVPGYRRHEFWHRRFPRAVSRDALMIVTPLADRYTVVHERKHIHDNAWLDAAFGQVERAVDKRHFPSHDVEDVGMFISEQRAFAAELADREKHGNQGANAWVDRDVVLESLAVSYGGDAIERRLTELRRTDTVSYARLIAVISSIADPSKTLPLSAVLPRHFAPESNSQLKSNGY